MLNDIHNEDCLQTMQRMPDNFIDLTVTSPPYDDLRSYHGYSFDFENVAHELFRVTRQGGVVVWVVGDSAKNGNESGTSFRQALYFKEIGFNLGDTMIWQKTNPFNFGSNYFYTQSFEYMFILVKGKPNTSNLIRDKTNASFGKTFKQARRENGGDNKEYDNKDVAVTEYGKRSNIWSYSVESNFHVAPFPEALAKDHILSWSNPNDIVYDPFSGSGTTCLMALLNKRQYIGSEISNEYTKLSKDRLSIYLDV